MQQHYLVYNISKLIPCGCRPTLLTGFHGTYNSSIGQS